MSESNHEDKRFDEFAERVWKGFHEELLKERKRDPNAADNETIKIMHVAAFLVGVKETGLYRKPVSEWTPEDCDKCVDHALWHFRLVFKDSLVAAPPEVRGILLRGIDDESHKEYFRNLMQVFQGKLHEA